MNQLAGINYPYTFQNKDGVELVARDEVQGAAFVNNGFKPVEKPKQTRQPKTEE